jgi:hypothetical protein
MEHRFAARTLPDLKGPIILYWLSRAPAAGLVDIPATHDSIIMRWGIFTLKSKFVNYFSLFAKFVVYIIRRKVLWISGDNQYALGPNLLCYSIYIRMISGLTNQLT